MGITGGTRVCNALVICDFRMEWERESVLHRDHVSLSQHVVKRDGVRVQNEHEIAREF